jgi:hypothetical protein
MGFGIHNDWVRVLQCSLGQFHDSVLLIVLVRFRSTFA